MTDLRRDQERALVMAGWLTPRNAEAMAATVVRLNKRVRHHHDLLVDARDLLLGALSSDGIADADRGRAAVTVKAIEQLLFGKAEH